MLPRIVTPSLESRLRVMAAVVVTGARRTGKSTLAQELAPGRRRFLSLDDLDVADAARHDPEARQSPIALDEVQREPDLLHAVKRAKDRRRQPGMFSHHRFGQPVAHAPGVRVPRGSCELPDPLADDPARAAGLRARRYLGGVA